MKTALFIILLLANSCPAKAQAAESTNELLPEPFWLVPELIYQDRSVNKIQESLGYEINIVDDEEEADVSEEKATDHSF